MLIVFCLCVAGQAPLEAQEAAAKVASITAAEQLALEQIDQLVATDQVDEAVRLIIRTMDESEGRLVAVPRGSETGAEFARFVPLRLFLQDRLLRWGITRPAILNAYRQRADAAALARLAAARQSGQVHEAVRVAERFLATRHGDEALLLAADLAIERGWMWRAVEYLRRIDSRWQAVDAGPRAGEAAAVGWEMVLPRLPADQITPLAIALDDQTVQAWPFASYHEADLDQAAVGLRLVTAYRACGELGTARRLAEMVRVWYPRSRVTFLGSEQTIEAALDQLFSSPVPVEFQAAGATAGDDWATLGHDATRIYRTGPLGDLSMLPMWTAAIPEPAGADVPGPIAADASIRLPVEPPIGGPPIAAGRSFPIIHQGLVLYQTERQLFARRLEDGSSWPVDDASEPFYRDGERDDLLPVSGALPVDGEPQYSLSADRGRVAARFGPSPSGWLAVVRPQRALSRVLVVDLQQEGRILDGYPARPDRLAGDAIDEFEGVPLIVGSRLYAGVTARDDAALNSSVVCIDLVSGEQLFRTPTISSARPLGAGNRMAHSLVSYRQGMLYYHGDSGAVAAIDAEDGSLHWVARYARAELDSTSFPHRRRAARIQSAPVALLGPLALVTAADSDRLIAVDALSGRLLWATGPGEADDVDQILGEVDGRIIAGGDSLYWLHRESGKVVAQWPSATTRQPHGALPDPRRAGRGLIAGDQIYWPTSEAIWVFDAGPGKVGDTSVARPLRRIDLQALGLRGGDLVAADGVLVMRSPGMLAAFAGPRVYNGGPSN